MQTRSLVRVVKILAINLLVGLLLSCIVALNAAETEGKAPADEMLPGKGPAQKGEWFDKVWTQRRAEFRKSATADKGAVVFLGDSITQGWGNVGEKFPKYHCANRGISGDTARGILFRLDEDVLALKPAAVVLLIGTNDIGIDTTPEEAADNIKMILARLKASNPQMPIVVCKVMPSSASKQRPADKIQKLNSLVDAIVKTDVQFIRCDTYSIFANESGDAKKEEFPDLLHPNTAGYAKWIAALNPILASFMKIDDMPVLPAAKVR